MWCAARLCASAGFHTTTLPMSAGAEGRLPAMAVKLNGVMAKTKPSSGRSSSALDTPGDESGCSTRRDAKATLKRRKSISSHAAVDLRLVRGLALSEHGGGVDELAPRAGEELGGAEEDARALVEGRARPRGRGLERRGDGALGDVRASVVPACEEVRVAVRRAHLEARALVHVEAADHVRDVRALVLHALDRGLERGALRRAGRIGEDGLVRREGPGRRDVEHGPDGTTERAARDRGASLPDRAHRGRGRHAPLP